MSTKTECAPENCPALTWANMSEAERRVNRKREAERLYKQNFSMEEIAAVLGVSIQTISTDLKEFSNDLKTNPRTSKRGRKGEGRPKGSARPRKPPDVAAKHEKIITLFDGGLSSDKIATEVGVGQRMVGRVLEVERARREAQPLITPDMLSMTAQQKLNAAIKQHKQKLDAAFDKAVNDRVQQFLMDTILPQHRVEQAEAKRVMETRRGVMNKATFNQIRRALHPDSRKSISDKVLSDAFDAFMRLEKLLLDEKNSPTSFAQLPKTWADWEKAKRDTSMRRRTKGFANVARY